MPYYRPTQDLISGRTKGRGLFGFTPEQINEARTNLNGPIARTIGRHLAQLVHADISVQVRDAAQDLRSAIERKDVSVTGSLRRSITARGTGVPTSPRAQPTRRTMDVEYAPYLVAISDGTGPQGFPPARKRGGHLIYSREDAETAGPANIGMFIGSTNAQYGLLDWIEMKGIVSEKYPEPYDLYKAIGMSIKRSGVRAQHIFEDAWGTRNWWQQQDTLFDTAYDISLNFGQGKQQVLTDQWFKVLMTFYRGGNLPAGLIAQGPSSESMQEVAKFAQGRVVSNTNITGR